MIDELITEIKKRLPTAVIKIDKAEHPDAPSWVDVDYLDGGAIIRCWTSHGYGINIVKDDKSSYGEGPEKISKSVEEIVEYMVSKIGGIY